MLNRHIPNKKPKTNKGFFRLSIVFLLALFGFNMLLIFLPEKAFAAPTVKEEYKVWRSYTIVADCLDNGFSKNDIGTNDQAIIDNIFKSSNETKGTSLEVGELFVDIGQVSDSGVDCNTKEDIIPAITNLGFKDVKDFADFLNKDLGDKNLSNEQIRDKLQGVVTSKGVRLNLADKPDFQYWYWTEIYRNGTCKGILSNEYKSGYETNTTVNAPYWFVDPKNPKDAPDSYSYANFKIGEDEGVEKLDGIMAKQINKGAPSCVDIAGELTKVRAEAYLATLKANPDEAAAAPGSSSATESEDDGCESNGGVLGWIMCPVVKLLDNGVGFLDQKIRDLMYVKSSDYFASDSDLMTTWKNIRNIAYIILVPIMLVMVIGTALGFEVFSAYTVKKALPRMVFAVIFIALSWYICVFMVNFTNVLGAGAKGIVTAPFMEGVSQEGDPPILAAMKNAKIVSGSSDGSDGADGGKFAALGAGTLAAGGALYFAGALSIGIIISTFFTAALILGAIFLLLVFRQMLIIALVIIAPLAILAWIFPGNDKMWKLWWGSFTKLLLIFPLIMLLAGVGQAFAMITGSATAANDGAEGGQLVAIIIIIAAYIMPFVLIPFAFKWAGGVFGNIAGMVNDRERGVLDRLKKGRGDMRAKHMNNAKSFQRFKGRNALTRGMNNLGGMSTNKPGAWITPGRLQASREGAQAAKAAEDLKNDKIYQANQNDDKFLLALGNQRLARKMMNDSTSEADRASWQSALTNASLVSSRGTQGTKLAALAAHSATGYNLAAGQEGYNQLAQSYVDALNVDEKDVQRDSQGNITGVTGSQAGSFASHMNTAQYGLKSAGRFDLGGINNGAGYDMESGIGKASLYQLANGKKQAITSMVEEKFGASGPLNPAQLEDASVTYKELQSMLPNATGATADEIMKQMARLEPEVTQYMNQSAVDSSGATITKEVSERFDTQRGDSSHARYDAAYVASWTPAELAQGSRKTRVDVKNGENVEKRARTYQRPDPNNLD